MSTAWTDQRNSHPANWRPRAKLTPMQRQEIAYRRGDGERVIDLAAEYGVSRGVITNAGVLYR